MALHRVVPSVPALGGKYVESDQTQRKAAGIALGEWGLGSSRWRLGPMVGRSAAMERLFLQMRYLSNHLRIALLEGERGTGKQLAARTLHELSPHRAAAFVSCPAVRFFANDSAEGLLAAAAGGTLYLSGVEELNHEQQGRLLQLLVRLGYTGSRSLADPRPSALAMVPNGQQPRALLASSARSLRSLVLYGKFRGDLHAALSSVHMVLPPLRDRREDIPLLLDHFLKRLPVPLEGRRLRGYAPDLLPALLAQRWAGNVAELASALAAAAANCGGEWLRARDLPPAGAAPTHAVPSVWVARPGEGPKLQSAPPADEAPKRRAETPAPARDNGAPKDAEDGEPTLDPNLDRAILRHIRRVLRSVNGNKLRAARLLGISRSTLYRLLESEAAREKGDPGTGMAV